MKEAEEQQASTSPDTEETKLPSDEATPPATAESPTDPEDPTD